MNTDAELQASDYQVEIIETKEAVIDSENCVNSESNEGVANESFETCASQLENATEHDNDDDDDKTKTHSEKVHPDIQRKKKGGRRRYNRKNVYPSLDNELKPDGDIATIDRERQQRRAAENDGFPTMENDVEGRPRFKREVRRRNRWKNVDGMPKNEKIEDGVTVEGSRQVNGHRERREAGENDGFPTMENDVEGQPRAVQGGRGGRRRNRTRYFDGRQDKEMNYNEEKRGGMLKGRDSMPTDRSRNTEDNPQIQNEFPGRTFRRRRVGRRNPIKEYEPRMPNDQREEGVTAEGNRHGNGHRERRDGEENDGFPTMENDVEGRPRTVQGGRGRRRNRRWNFDGRQDREMNHVEDNPLETERDCAADGSVPCPKSETLKENNSEEAYRPRNRGRGGRKYRYKKPDPLESSETQKTEKTIKTTVPCDSTTELSPVPVEAMLKLEEIQANNDLCPENLPEPSSVVGPQ